MYDKIKYLGIIWHLSYKCSSLFRLSLY